MSTLPCFSTIFHTPRRTKKILPNALHSKTSKFLFTAGINRRCLKDCRIAKTKYKVTKEMVFANPRATWGLNSENVKYSEFF